MVFDGLGNPRLQTDVGIKEGLITAVGKLRSGDADRVIDATGLHVAPGFVDLHTHYDAQLFWDPYCSLSGWHGVTSVVIGNCGFGFAPVREVDRERAMLTMTRNEAISMDAMRLGMPWDWETFPEFLDSVERAPKAVNVLPYVGLNPLMTWVMGLDRAKAGELPTDEEHIEMQRLLNEAMDAGACGFSAQRMGQNSGQRDYDGTAMVTDLLHDETMMALADVLYERQDGFIQYLYADLGQGKTDVSAEGFTTSVSMPAQRHIEAVAARSGRPIIWNALMPSERLLTGALSWLESTRKRGLPIYPQVIHEPTIDFFFDLTWEFAAWDTSDPWRALSMGSPADRKRLLADPHHRDLLRKATPELNFVLGDVADWVLWRGKTEATSKYDEIRLREIAAAEGKDVIDAFCDIELVDDLQARFYVHCGREATDETRKKLIDYPYGVAGASDGGAHTKFSVTSKYSTSYITEYTRKFDWLSLEEVHRRLSYYPAFVAGLRNRGTITKGAAADIVVYDYDTLDALPIDVVHDLPGGDWRVVSRAVGYRFVLVNGKVTIEDDKETGETSAGQLLRYGYGQIRNN
jgi:N-acyl-D-amino-acid deacylase